mgnify:FL=1
MFEENNPQSLAEAMINIMTNEALRRSYMPKKYWSFLIEMK